MGKKVSLGTSQDSFPASSTVNDSEIARVKPDAIENNLTAKNKINVDMGKENSPMKLRRSSRNKPSNSASTKQDVVELKLPLNSELKTAKTVKSSVMNPSKRKTVRKGYKLKSDVPCQSKIAFKVESKSQAEVPSESKQDTDVTKGYEYLITDEAPASYWKEFAALRQSALEATLQENESLRDKLVVLLSENETLKTAAKCAESLASFVMKNLDKDQLQSLE